MDSPTADSTTASGGKQIFLTIRERGVKDDSAYAFRQGVVQTAGQNLLAQVQVQNEKFVAQLDSQLRELRQLRWTTGLGFVALAIEILVFEFLI